MMRLIPGCPGYSASDDGKVWSHWIRRGFGPAVIDMAAGPRELAQFDRKRYDLSPSGYRSVSLVRGTKRCNRYVHDLVLLTFVGPRPVDEWGPIQALHRNSKPWDNRLDNLRWGTVDENMADRKAKQIAKAWSPELDHCFSDMV